MRLLCILLLSLALLGCERPRRQPEEKPQNTPVSTYSPSVHQDRPSANSAPENKARAANTDSPPERTEPRDDTAAREREAARRAEEARRAIEQARDLDALEKAWVTWGSAALKESYDKRRKELLADLRTDILREIAVARTAGEAATARAKYTHKEGTEDLDLAVAKRIDELDKAEYDKALSAIAKAATFEDVARAAAGYTGTKRKADLEKASRARMIALEASVFSALKNEAKSAGSDLTKLNELISRLRAFAAMEGSKYAKEALSLIADLEKKQMPLLENAAYFIEDGSFDVAEVLPQWTLVKETVTTNGDGTQLLVVGTDENARIAVLIVDVALRKLVVTHYAPSAPQEAHLARDSNVAVLRIEGTITVVTWDVKNKQVKELRKTDATACAISPDGKRVVVASSYSDAGKNVNRPLLYEPGGGRLLNEPKVTHRTSILDVEFSDDGSHFVTLDAEGAIGLWGTSNGGLRFQYTRRHERTHKAGFHCGIYWFGLGGDGSASFMSLGKDADLFTLSGFSGSVTAITGTKKDKYIAVADNKAMLKIFDARTREELKVLDLKSTHIVRLSWSNDGLTLTGVDPNGTVRFFRAPRA